MMRLSVFLLAVLSATAMAQLAFQAPSTAYEGQKVSSVSLIANPHRDLGPLYPLLTQRAGEPYSQQEIDADSKALQRAGRFPEVKVSVVPQVDGLRVEFLLEPAYYLGVVEFPGATKEFAYIRLLQVTDLSGEDPYDPSHDSGRPKSPDRFLSSQWIFSGRGQGTAHNR